MNTKLSMQRSSDLESTEIAKIGGGYNVFLQTSLPASLRVYNPEEETADSSLTLLKLTFSGGFPLEILEVYSGPPVIVYKFRHWCFMEGPFKGHAPTGENFLGWPFLSWMSTRR